MGAAPEAMDTLEEVAAWIANDETGAAALANGVKANADAILAINNETTGIAAVAKGYTDAEVAKLAQADTDNLAAAKKYADDEIAKLTNAETGILALAKAHSDANLATAKKYTDDSIVALQASIHGVDDNTIKLKDNKAYVAEVSTDVLVQGAEELILSAGNASGYTTV